MCRAERANGQRWTECDQSVVCSEISCNMLERRTHTHICRCACMSARASTSTFACVESTLAELGEWRPLDGGDGGRRRGGAERVHRSYGENDTKSYGDIHKTLYKWSAKLRCVDIEYAMPHTRKL